MTFPIHLQATDKRPWYREPWPWLLMSGPVIVIVAGFITAWLAVRSNDGLVTEDYYKQGLAINQQLEREKRAGDMGLRGQVMRSGNQLRVMLAIETAQKSLPEQLTLKITHPTRAGMDQSIALVASGPGMFSGRLESDVSGYRHVVLEDPAGQWRLHGEWQADEAESFQLLSGVLTSTINSNVTGR